MAYLGCPHSSIRGKDVFSDKEAVRLMCPKHLDLQQPSFDDVGWHLLQFFGQMINVQPWFCYVLLYYVLFYVVWLLFAWFWMVLPWWYLANFLVYNHFQPLTWQWLTAVRFWHALIFGVWNSSPEFTVPELVSNTFGGWYLLLILTMSAWERRGTKLWSIWLPQCTTRNVARMLAHMMLRLKFWPNSAVFEPVCTAEDAAEHFFGEVKCYKRGSQGTSSTSNSIQAAQLIHTRRAMAPLKAGWDWAVGCAWSSWFELIIFD